MTTFNRTSVILKQGDITQERVDAIVNAANSDLRGGSGVDGAIHAAGGSVICEECDRIREQQGGCPTGQAVITSAGKMDAKYVIHTAGPDCRRKQGNEAELLRSAYTSSLNLARENGVRTIAFPSISTGVYAYPIRDAARIALGAVRAFALQHSQPGEIRFVLFSDSDLKVYQAALEELQDSGGR